MSDPQVLLDGLEAEDPRVQQTRSRVLAGDFDRVDTGTTTMEKFFNKHTAQSAREYVYHHPEDSRFVPSDLPEPNLITMRAQGGLMEKEFDGEPWFPSDKGDDE